MKLIEALQNAREFLEALGYGAGGDIHDDLNLAICHLQNYHPKVTQEELPERDVDDRAQACQDATESRDVRCVW